MPPNLDGFSEQCHQPRARIYLQVQLIIKSYDGVVGPGGRQLALRWAPAVAAGNKHLPAVVWHLELIQVEGGKVIHKVALHLATKDVDSRTQNVQGVAVSTGRPDPAGQRS